MNNTVFSILAYYNYHNSLLDCLLEVKKGIPITLVTLYSCVLGIFTHLVVLPGHLILGFWTKMGVAQFVDG